MDPTMAIVLIASVAGSFALGLVLGSLRAKARTSLEKAALDTLKLGDHPPTYAEPPTPPKEEPKP
jgi:hypothetical protein